LATFVAALIVGVGCVSAEEQKKWAVHPVVRMAPFDLDCPEEKLSYKHIDDETWGVVGCGRRTKYVRICNSRGVECRWLKN
jgi:hypothetical protein